METEREIVELKTQLKMLEAKIGAIESLLSREGLVEEDSLQDELDRILKHNEHKK
jgi:hypothetical protein